MNENTIHDSADEYIKAQPEETQKALLELRSCIFKAAPKATELLNYNIPAYALIEGGKREQQIMMAGYKKHVGLYPHPSVMERFDDELREYKKGKGSVQFPIGKPLPTQLIIKMVKYRVEQLTTKNGKKKIVSGVVHDVPDDLRKALIVSPRVLGIWEEITPLARNEWICWIENAKKSETRDRRIERTCSELLEGKRRPCCWAGCTHR